MSIHFNLLLINNQLVARGLGALVLIVVILIFPSFLVVPMDPETAEREIRLYLKRIAMSQPLDVLKATGRGSIPSSSTKYNKGLALSG